MALPEPAPAPLPPLAGREVALVAGVLGALLLGLSGRYGYSRDELYFLEAGHHLAWGYPDQPPLIPLLARIADLVAPGSLPVLRLPATAAATGIVVVAALIAREVGARRGGQVLAAAATALSGVVMATGHLLSTTTIALLGWAALSLLLVRILCHRPPRAPWIWVGVVAGLTTEANPVVVGLLVVLALALAVVGPRSLLATPGPYVAAGIAAALAAPYVVWQVRHGLPQLDVARGIADGASGTSASRAAFVPWQLLVVGPWLTPIWVVGLVRCLRSRALRVLGVAYLALCVLVLVAGGKPYYVAGLYPLLLALGAQPFLDRVRSWVPVVLLALSLPVVVFALPVLPVQHAGIVVAAEYDVGETIGWPSLVGQVATAYRTLPAGTAIIADNYGQAGAIDRYGPELGLPLAFSGHNAYADWRRPGDGTSTVLAVGIDPALLERSFASCSVVGTLRNPWGIENDELGTRLSACRGPVRPWSRLWADFTHVG